MAGIVLGCVVLAGVLAVFASRCRHLHPHTERNRQGRLEMVCDCGWRKPFNLHRDYTGIRHGQFGKKEQVQ